jgi:hypothetical protein
MSDERKAKALAEALDNLAPFFDTVQIFVTKHGGSDDTTSSTSIGKGNIYARLSQARLWLEVQEAQLVEAMYSSDKPPQDPEGDGQE